METCILLSVTVSVGEHKPLVKQLSKYGELLVRAQKCAAVEQDYQEMLQDT
jgi:hypothetical protein